MRADSVHNYGDSFASLEESEGGGLYGAFDADADKDEIVCLDFAKEAVDARLIEGVEAAFVQDDLLVSAEHIAGQVGVAISGEDDPIIEQGVADFFLAFGAIDAGGGQVVVFSGAGTDIGDGDDGDIPCPCPGHNAADVGEDSPVVSDTGLTFGEQEILLGVDVNKKVPASSSDQLQNHFLASPGGSGNSVL